jgi:hypothetical protein
VASKGRGPASQVIDRAGERRGQDGQRVSLARGLLASGQRLLACGMVPEHKAGGCRARPGARGVVNRGARGVVPCARRCCGACAQTAGGHKRLHAWETTDSVECIQEPQTQDLPDPGYRLPLVEGRGGVLLGGPDTGALHVVEPLVGVPQQGQVHRDGLLDRRISQPRSESVPGGLVGEVRAAGREVLLVRGLRHGGQPCCPCAPPMHPPSAQVPRRPQRGGLDRRLGSLPARRSPAMFWASSGSCGAVPPWIACR